MKDKFIHHTAIVDEGVEIGLGTQVWHFCHLLSGTRVGSNCNFGQNVMIGPNVTVGNGCKIQNNVSLYSGVTLEDEVFCGPSCVFTNVLTPRSFISRKEEFVPTFVRRGCSIGANATIVCGVTLGKYSMIGAGSVITKDVPDYALVVGNPGKFIGWISRTGDKLGENLVCPRTNERYSLNSDGLLEELTS